MYYSFTCHSCLQRFLNIISNSFKHFEFYFISLLYHCYILKCRKVVGLVSYADVQSNFNFLLLLFHGSPECCTGHYINVGCLLQMSNERVHWQQVLCLKFMSSGQGIDTVEWIDYWWAAFQRMFVCTIFVYQWKPHNGNKYKFVLLLQLAIKWEG